MWHFLHKESIFIVLYVSIIRKLSTFKKWLKISFCWSCFWRWNLVAPTIKWSGLDKGLSIAKTLSYGKMATLVFKRHSYQLYLRTISFRKKKQPVIQEFIKSIFIPTLNYQIEPCCTNVAWWWLTCWKKSLALWKAI